MPEPEEVLCCQPLPKDYVSSTSDPPQQQSCCRSSPPMEACNRGQTSLNCVRTIAHYCCVKSRFEIAVIDNLYSQALPVKLLCFDSVHCFREGSLD